MKKPKPSSEKPAPPQTEVAAFITVTPGKHVPLDEIKAYLHTEIQRLRIYGFRVIQTEVRFIDPPQTPLP